MNRLVKQPTPRNFKNKSISMTPQEAEEISIGTTLVILKYEDTSEVFAVVTVSEQMLGTIRDHGGFFTMRWSA